MSCQKVLHALSVLFEVTLMLNLLNESELRSLGVSLAESRAPAALDGVVEGSRFDIGLDVSASTTVSYTLGRFGECFRHVWRPKESVFR